MQQREAGPLVSLICSWHRAVSSRVLACVSGLVWVFFDSFDSACPLLEINQQMKEGVWKVL